MAVELLRCLTPGRRIYRAGMTSLRVLIVVAGCGASPHPSGGPPGTAAPSGAGLPQPGASPAIPGDLTIAQFEELAADELLATLDYIDTHCVDLACFRGAMSDSAAELLRLSKRSTATTRLFESMTKEDVDRWGEGLAERTWTFEQRKHYYQRLRQWMRDVCVDCPNPSRGPSTGFDARAAAGVSRDTRQTAAEKFTADLRGAGSTTTAFAGGSDGTTLFVVVVPNCNEHMLRAVAGATIDGLRANGFRKVSCYPESEMWFDVPPTGRAVVTHGPRDGWHCAAARAKPSVEICYRDRATCDGIALTPGLRDEYEPGCRHVDVAYCMFADGEGEREEMCFSAAKTCADGHALSVREGTSPTPCEPRP